MSRRRGPQAGLGHLELTPVLLVNSQSNLELVSTRREGEEKKGEKTSAANEEVKGKSQDGKGEPKEAAAAAKTTTKADAASQKEEGA